MATGVTEATGATVATGVSPADMRGSGMMTASPSLMRVSVESACAAHDVWHTENAPWRTPSSGAGASSSPAQAVGDLPSCLSAMKVSATIAGMASPIPVAGGISGPEGATGAPILHDGAGDSLISVHSASRTVLIDWEWPMLGSTPAKKGGNHRLTLAPKLPPLISWVPGSTPPPKGGNFTNKSIWRMKFACICSLLRKILQWQIWMTPVLIWKLLWGGSLRFNGEALLRNGFIPSLVRSRRKTMT